MFSISSISRESISSTKSRIITGIVGRLSSIAERSRLLPARSTKLESTVIG